MAQLAVRGHEIHNIDTTVYKKQQAHATAWKLTNEHNWGKKKNEGDTCRYIYK